jgi:uncharacterized membrane protein YfcA
MLLIITLVSFLATVLSSMSGAGSSMITVPIWIFAGYPLPVALTASKINGAFWTPIAAYNYLKKISIDPLLIILLVTFGLTGGYFGTLIIAKVESNSLQRIFGGLILLLVLLTYKKKDFGT